MSTATSATCWRLAGSRSTQSATCGRSCEHTSSRCLVSTSIPLSWVEGPAQVSHQDGEARRSTRPISSGSPAMPIPPKKSSWVLPSVSMYPISVHPPPVGHRTAMLVGSRTWDCSAGTPVCSVGQRSSISWRGCGWRRYEPVAHLSCPMQPENRRVGVWLRATR